MIQMDVYSISMSIECDRFVDKDVMACSKDVRWRVGPDNKSLRLEPMCVIMVFGVRSGKG